MRSRFAVTVIAASLAALAFAPAAHAEGCHLGGGPYQYQGALTPWLGPSSDHNTDGATGAAKEALGAQYAALWLSDAEQGWDVGLAPGPLDAAAARTAIAAALAKRFDQARVDFLMSALHVVPQPYGEADLQAVQQQVFALLNGMGLQSGVGISCTMTDSMRVEAMVLTGDAEPTAEQQAAVAAALAPFGDKVRWELRKGAITPGADATPQTNVSTLPLVATYVRLARASRCVHGAAITVKALRRDDLRSVTVTSRGHSTTLRPGRSARVRLHRPATKVTVTVKLRNLPTATQTYRYTRC
jgi:hypothetical protein